MKGHILDFSVQTNSGIVSGGDGLRYAFQGPDWMESEPPRRGMPVDFTAVGGRAASIYAAAPVDSASGIVATLAAGQDQFTVRNTVLADVRVRFELGETRFDLPCTVVEKLAPKPALSIEYNSQDERHIDEEKMHKLWQAMMDSAKIPATITDSVTFVKAELFGGSFPQLWFSFSGQPFKAIFYISSMIDQVAVVNNITEVNFNIINMTTLNVCGHTIIFDGGWQMIGSAVLQNDEWTFCIRQHPRHSDAQNYLRTIGGFQITHIGSLYKTDGSEFTQDEAVSQLSAIRTFLSFANGARVGITRASGVNRDWKTIWDCWKISIADWSDGFRPLSWFNSQDGANPDEPMVLSELFPEFCRLVQFDANITRAIEWYLTANAWGPFINLDSSRAVAGIAAITLAQAANGGWRNLDQDLKMAGLSTDIPSVYSDLKQLYDQNKNWHNQSVGTGVVALQRLRNYVEHPTSNIKGVQESWTSNAFYEALQLGQWYLESLILHKCGYTGPRANRVQGGKWETLGQAAI